MGVYIAALGFGLVSAAVLAVAAVGFTMQFAITDILNLAYGGVMIAGAYVAYFLNQRGVNIWIDMMASAAAGAVISVLLNRFLYTPFQRRKASHVTLIIVTLATGIIITNAMLGFAGPNSVTYTFNGGPTLRWGSFQLTSAQLGIIALSVALMASIHALLRFTRLGKAMRATASNPNLARNCGIRTGRVISVTWLITGALCGIAGTVFALDSGSFVPSSAAGFIVVILAAAILGGVGQPYGAMLGALLIGEVTELSAAAWSPDYKDVIAFVLLLIVMVARPQGILLRGATR